LITFALFKKLTVIFVTINNQIRTTMTIQKLQVNFGDKTYDVILEDGVVSYIDPSEPLITKELLLAPDMKVTSLEDAKRMVLQVVKKEYTPSMTFSD